MIRPELRDEAVRWREALTGAAILVVGVWLALAGVGPTVWVGAALGVAGVALAVAGWQRGRFRSGGGGPGVVTVDEARLTYFGPLTGGSVPVRDLVRVGIDPRGRPAHWVLETAEETLHVPVTAEGGDALFDVFSGLAGLEMSRVLGVLRSPPAGPTVLWQAARAGGAPRLARPGSPSTGAH